MYKNYYFFRCTHFCIPCGCFRCTTMDMHLIFKALKIIIMIIIIIIIIIIVNSF